MSVALAVTPVQNQTNFRILLKAMAFPGQRYQLNFHGGSGGHPGLQAVQCLLDHEVTFAVEGQGDEAEQAQLRKTVIVATGARPALAAEADFILIQGSNSRGAVRQAKRGSMTFPDNGATVIYLLNEFKSLDSQRLRVRLCGPGIASQAGIAPQMAGMRLEELRALGQVNLNFPLGVDAFFIGITGEVMGLPRSVRIEME